jgi:hypothetical protein
VFILTFLLYSGLPDCDSGCGYSYIPLFGLGFCFAIFSVVYIPTVMSVVLDKKVTYSSH